MEFCFDKAACLNIRRALRKEWLLTNGTGDYSSSTILCCNTRKYHGLLVANLDTPPGRHVLLSTTEESVLGGGKEFFFSTRKHPGVFFPHGHEYMEGMQVKDWPLFRYKVGDLTLTRELALVRGRTLLLTKYTVSCESTPPPLTLRIKPLLAYRNFHALTSANGDLQVRTFPVKDGFTIRPYDALPPLFMQVKGRAEFFPSPDWYRNIDYLVEEERGFPHEEDLFLPGVFDIALPLDSPVFVSASTEEITEDLEALWEEETGRRRTLSRVADTMLGHFVRQGSRFMATPPGQSVPVVLAGYHWFDAWGRDTCIALPGLTFCAGRLTKG
ncbi:MAG: amylo-alpha-1,6-glucosidase, partial [Desulfovibrionaceae bacterium]|nr:amylo-alpha-1,6-glucosidase [Desulfovibrionaceae bacterium]